MPKESKKAKNARLRREDEAQQKARQRKRLGVEPPTKPKHEAKRGKDKK